MTEENPHKKVDYIDECVLSITRGNTLMGDLEILTKFSEHRKNIVEIGTAYGLGAITLHGKSFGKITTIDTHEFYREHPEDGIMYSEKQKYNIVKDFFKLFSKGKIETIINDSVKEAENWDNESVDLLFIDGGHSYEQVKADYEAWLPKVEKDGVIIFHDVSKVCIDVWDFWNNVILKEIKMKRVRELVQKPKYETVCKVVVKL
jgi:hypothetical protein